MGLHSKIRLILRSMPRLGHWALLGVLVFPVSGFAQSQPTSLSISPGSIYQGQTYTMTAGNGSLMTLDVRYTLDGAGPYTANDWPALDVNGRADIQTNGSTATGNYVFTGIRNHVDHTAPFVDVNAPITVSVPPPQPTSLSFSPSQGYAGNDCFVMTVGNGANMTVDLQYSINGSPQPVATVTMNGSGQWSYCLNHFETQGPRVYTAIKNHLHWLWVSISPVTYTILPPQPTSFSVSPSSLTAGTGNMTMIAGNAANITLDVQYTLNGGPVQTTYSWPSMTSIGGGADGRSDIFVSLCTAPGNYVYTAVKNHANAPWVGVHAPITVYAPPPPTVSSLSPVSGARGTSVSVTINGTNLCGVSLSTTWPGLSFSNIVQDPEFDGNGISATFNISSSAWVGNASVTLTANGGSTSFNFAITNNAAPSVTGLSPSSTIQGTAPTVTITGANLAGATLSTSWSGLSFSNVSSSPDGTSMTATFNVAAGAAVGNPSIQVSTSAGSTTTQLFSILQAPVLTREYIYFGGRLIAID